LAALDLIRRRGYVRSQIAGAGDRIDAGRAKADMIAKANMISGANMSHAMLPAPCPRD
jgi:hypothetical protein